MAPTATATASGSADGSTAASTSRCAALSARKLDCPKISRNHGSLMSDVASSWDALSSPTQAPNGQAGSLVARGGGPGYTGTYAQYPPHYKPHTTINGSRTSFVVVTVIAGLVFFSLIGLGWWYMRFRRRKRLISRGASGSASSKRTSTGRPSGLFGRNTNGSSRPWGRLRDNDNDNDAEDDAFAMAPSANVSVMDLNGQDLSHNLDTHELAKRWNPAYAASGESLNWQDDKDAGAGNARRPAENTKEAEYVKVERQ